MIKLKHEWKDRTYYAKMQVEANAIMEHVGGSFTVEELQDYEDAFKVCAYCGTSERLTEVYKHHFVCDVCAEVYM